MDMDDVKDELRAALMDLYDDIPENMTTVATVGALIQSYLYLSGRWMI